MGRQRAAAHRKDVDVVDDVSPHLQSGQADFDYARAWFCKLHASRKHQENETSEVHMCNCGICHAGANYVLMVHTRSVLRSQLRTCAIISRNRL